MNKAILKETGQPKQIGEKQWFEWISGDRSDRMVWQNGKPEEN